MGCVNSYTTSSILTQTRSNRITLGKPLERPKKLRGVIAFHPDLILYTVVRMRRVQEHVRDDHRRRRLARTKWVGLERLTVLVHFRPVPQLLLHCAQYFLDFASVHLGDEKGRDLHCRIQPTRGHAISHHITVVIGRYVHPATQLTYKGKYFGNLPAFAYPWHAAEPNQ